MTAHVKASASTAAKHMMRDSASDGVKAIGGACAMHGTTMRASMILGMSILLARMSMVIVRRKTIMSVSMKGAVVDMMMMIGISGAIWWNEGSSVAM
jgi:hypothetical protein